MRTRDFMSRRAETLLVVAIGVVVGVAAGCRSGLWTDLLAATPDAPSALGAVGSALKRAVSTLVAIVSQG